jgi:hypothetical protein
MWTTVQNDTVSFTVARCSSFYTVNPYWKIGYRTGNADSLTRQPRVATEAGPFGGDGAVVASCHNLVRKNTDPSAHASEVAAIRQVSENAEHVCVWIFHLFPHTVAGLQEARETRPLRI